MGVFDKIPNAPMPGTRSATKAGVYKCILELLQLKVSANPKGHGGENFVVMECTVLEVLTGYEDSHKAGHRIGRPFMIESKRGGDFAVSELKEAIAALVPCDFADVSADICTEATAGDGTSLRGSIFVVTAQASDKADAQGQPYVNVRYSALPTAPIAV